MQKRKFIIKIYKDYDWEIKLKTLSDYTLYPEFEVDIFSIARQTIDRKIVYLFDATIEQEKIDISKEDIRFNELCKFKAFIDDGAGEETSSEFDGTIIDALEYIQKNFAD